MRWRLGGVAFRLALVEQLLAVSEKQGAAAAAGCGSDDLAGDGGLA
jgi:hypothetical protein